MAKHRSPAQRAATQKLIRYNKSRKRHHNPSPRKATKRRRYAAANPRHHSRRRVHRNPGGFGRGILGELASKDGLMLLGAAAIAPTAVDMVAAAVVPIQYSMGLTGLAAKGAIAVGLTYAVDRFINRKAAIGFAAGSLGSLLLAGYKTFMTQQALPAAVTANAPAVADEIAKNPTLYKSLMDSGDWSSLNGYAATPMGGYAATPMGDWESLN